MTTYIIRRAIQAAIVLLIISILIFLVMRILPGDPILMYLTREDVQIVTEEEITALRHEWGLDRPLLVQYFTWLGDSLRGDLGASISHRTKVLTEIGERLPVTMHLGLVAFIISIIVGIPAGVISALRRGKWVDTVVTALANMGVTVPIFWLGIMLLYAFALKFPILPVYGYTSPLDDFWLSTRQAILPVFCLAVFAIASAARLTRSSMLEVMRQDYIRTAWSKGLTERLVIMRHALKNSLIPVVTLKGMTLSHIIGGSVLIETVFSIPGMGRLAVDGIRAHDYPVVQGITLVIATVVVLANLLVDLSYGWLDPRVRYG
jgi:peptide/nickel transport system permease protein